MEAWALGRGSCSWGAGSSEDLARSAAISRGRREAAGVETEEKGDWERAFCVSLTWTHTQVLGELWEVKGPCRPQPSPRALTASTHSETEWQTFWLRKPSPPPFSGPCNSSLLVFPEINGLSILGRQ